MSEIDEVIAKLKEELKETENNANLSMGGLACIAEVLRINRQIREAKETKAKHEVSE